MAGIGFELRNLMDGKRDLFTLIRGYASAGLVAAGPWILTITGLSLLHALAPWLGRPRDYMLFRALVTYGFVFSLIGVGPVQLAYTRRIADMLYRGETDRVLPALITAFEMVALVQVLVGAALAIWLQLPLGIAVGAVFLYVVLSLAWVALIWLGVVKDHGAILRAYAAGMVVSVGLVVLLSSVLHRGDTASLLIGYAVGQGLTLVMLLRTILRGMRSDGACESTLHTSLREFPKLVGVGLLYNAGIWMDQIVIWMTQGLMLHKGVAFDPIYDACRFLAYLTVIPALSVNLVRVETTFYEGYRAFYGSILGGATLGTIRRRKARMLEVLRQGSLHLLRIQGAVSVLILLVAPEVLRALRVPVEATPVFRACIVGSCFHVFLLTTLLILMYFDLRSEALITAGVFFTLNLGLSLGLHHLGPAAVAAGYAISALLALLTGSLLLSRATEHLVRRTFFLQPEPQT